MGVVMVGWILGETVLIGGIGGLQGRDLVTGSVVVVGSVRLTDRRG